MATTNTETDLAALQLSPDRSTAPVSTIAGGKVRRIQAIYNGGTSADNELVEAGDIIKICKLPEGARVIIPDCNIVLDDPGTTLTVSIGDTDDTVAADPDRYVALRSLGTGGTIPWTAVATWGVAVTTPYTVQKECWLEMTIGTASGINDNIKIVFEVAFSLHN